MNGKVTVIYEINQKVSTPDGPGLVLGYSMDNGRLEVIVRRPVPGQQVTTAGTCLTPAAKVSGLWSYPLDLVS